KPFLIQSPSSTSQGRFSPDGRWLAYVSDESGRNEIYLEAFPGRQNKALVSTNGGTNPRWRRDGREVFYVSPPGQLMRLAVSTGQPLQLGVPGVLDGGVSRDKYDVTSDGQRFVVLSNVEKGRALPINIVVNWANENY